MTELTGIDLGSPNVSALSETGASDSASTARPERLAEYF